MIERQNFSGNPNPDVGDETEFVRCNFSQPAPVDNAGSFEGVRLFPDDDTPKTFIDCNLCNCETPPDSTITRCNTVIKEFRKVTGSDSVAIDGVTITTNTTSDFVYGKRTEVGYDYHELPREVVN